MSTLCVHEYIMCTRVHYVYTGTLCVPYLYMGTQHVPRQYWTCLSRIRDSAQARTSHIRLWPLALNYRQFVTL